jgi:hypothetical protein
MAEKMTEMKFRVDDELLAALRVAARAKGVSDAELCRRFLRQQLGLESAYSTVTVLQEALRSLLRDELAPTRRLAFLAAFEAAAANAEVAEAMGEILFRSPGGPPDKEARVRQLVQTAQARARAFAARRTREAHPEHDADPGPEALPQADEAVELDPVDAALFEEGGAC